MFLCRLFDVSKQVVGQAFVHGVNVLISDLAAHHSAGNPCVMYFLNILIDTTFGAAPVSMTKLFESCSPRGNRSCCHILSFTFIHPFPYKNLGLEGLYLWRLWRTSVVFVLVATSSCLCQLAYNNETSGCGLVCHMARSHSDWGLATELDRRRRHSSSNCVRYSQLLNQTVYIMPTSLVL